MTTLLLVLLCVLILTASMLLAPIELEVDSAERRLSLRFCLIARLTIQSGRQSQVHILWKTVEIKPAKPAAQSKRTKDKKTVKQRRPDMQRLRRALPDLLAGLRRAVRIREFRAALDSRDFVLNAQLFALQPWLAAHGLPIHVNFNNHNMLHAILVLSTGRLLMAALKFAWRVFIVFPPLKHQTEAIS